MSFHPAQQVPLDPDSEHARELLQRELARPEYHEPVSLLQRFTRWLNDLYEQVVASAAGAPSLVSTLMLLLLTVAVAALLAWAIPRVRRGQAGVRGGTGGVLDDPSLTAEHYRQRARRAVAEQRWDEGLLDSYRAIAAEASERTLIEDVPGRTAHEVAVSLRRAFPAQHGALADAADLFDMVRYGGRRADEEQARTMVALDDELHRTRPHQEARQPAPVHPWGPR